MLAGAGQLRDAKAADRVVVRPSHLEVPSRYVLLLNGACNGGPSSAFGVRGQGFWLYTGFVLRSSALETSI